MNWNIPGKKKKKPAGKEAAGNDWKGGMNYQSIRLCEWKRERVHSTPSFTDRKEHLFCEQIQPETWHGKLESGTAIPNSVSRWIVPHGSLPKP